jgi:hypothetical protein
MTNSDRNYWKKGRATGALKPNEEGTARQSELDAMKTVSK